MNPFKRYLTDNNLTVDTVAGILKTSRRQVIRYRMGNNVPHSAWVTLRLAVEYPNVYAVLI